MPSLAGAMPNVKATIATCADPRVEPAYLLGIQPGDAVLIRNIGGRVTPHLLEQLGLLGQIGAAVNAIPGGGGEFLGIVMHDTRVQARERDAEGHAVDASKKEIEYFASRWVVCVERSHR
jgi:carbonic anhydrase-like protein